MRAQQKQRRRVLLARKLGNQIRELDLAPRGVFGERLPCYLPAGAAELVLDITPGFLDGLRSRRAWPEVDQSLNIRESFFTRDLLPNFRSVGMCDRSREQKKNYESRKCSRAIHRLGRFNIWLCWFEPRRSIQTVGRWTCFLMMRVRKARPQLCSGSPTAVTIR